MYTYIKMFYINVSMPTPNTLFGNVLKLTILHLLGYSSLLSVLLLFLDFLVESCYSKDWGKSCKSSLN